VERFVTRLVAGRKAPYASWTFVEVPAAATEAIGHGPVRGTLAGAAFRGTAGRSGGVLRVPVTRDLLERAGVARGDRVEVALEVDPEPRPVEVPEELRAVLDADPALARVFASSPPSHRRAWARHVAEAKQPETRRRRAAKASEGIRDRRFPR
jgi:hypothetical protein